MNPVVTVDQDDTTLDNGDSSDENENFEEVDDPEEELFDRLAHLIFRGTARLENDVQPLLEQHPRLSTRQCTESGKTLLHYALIKQSTPLEILQYLIQMGTTATPSHNLFLLQDETTWTPLHATCGHDCCFPNSFERVQFIHERFPDAIWSTTESGETPLHLACDHDYRPSPPSEIIHYLVHHFPLATLIQRSKYGIRQTPLEILQSNYEEPYHAKVTELMEFLSNTMHSIEQQLLQAVLYNQFSAPPEEENETQRSSRNNHTPLLSRREWTLFLQNESLLSRLSCHAPLIHGVERMHQAGRFRALATNTTSSTTNNNNSNDNCQWAICQGVLVCAAVFDNINCLFLHVKENPSLCQRQTATTTL